MGLKSWFTGLRKKKTKEAAIKAIDAAGGVKTDDAEVVSEVVAEVVAETVDKVQKKPDPKKRPGRVKKKK